jgi:hypothetical protein
VKTMRTAHGGPSAWPWATGRRRRLARRREARRQADAGGFLQKVRYTDGCNRRAVHALRFCIFGVKT